PDGSGVTMMLVAIPMSLLYVVGWRLAIRAWRQQEGGGEVEGETGRPRTVVWSAVVLVGAVIVGVVYLGSPVFFAPPPGTPIASGTMEVTLPGFVIYSPIPLSQEMQTGGALAVGAATTVVFEWSAVASDGTAVSVELNGTPEEAFDSSSSGARLGALPTKWTGANLTSLSLATSGGNAGLYALNLSFAYTALDVGGRIVLSYHPTPLSAGFVPLAQVPIGLPTEGERDELDRGRFTSLDPNWQLGVGLDAVRARNETFRFSFTVGDIALPGRDVTLSVTRSFEWSAQERLDLWVRGTAGADFLYTWYVDARFGSLFPALEPA
ncbi:MAG: hypothetical protein R3291_05450, partial [Thermoplasmata archaeon]|nr:hypothetical protein [Thermoplasmata archaeon]